MHRILCTLGWLVALAAATLSTAMAADLDAEVLPLEEVQPGQTGYGLSVFAGRNPERFEVEVIGVWREVEPDTDYILARLSGMNLEESGVIAGMSGSPVYLEDRLVGAVAFAWPFSIHPIAGITPIASMRRLDEVSSGRQTAAADPGSTSWKQLVHGDPPDDLLDRRLAGLGPTPLEGAASGIGWSAAGFGSSTRHRLSRRLGPVSPTGQTAAVSDKGLAPGDSVAAVLVSGDMQLAATGTVTERSGDRILAFGHPFLGAGPISIPMATSEVVTVLANQANSFKITNLGEIVGAFDLDRKTGIRGQLGARAELTPMSIRIVGDRQRSFDLQLARMPMMTPTLAAISILGALESVTQSGGSQGLDLRSRIELDGDWGALDLEQSFDGPTAGLDAALYVLAFADYLVNNYLEEVAIVGISVELTQHPEPRLATLIEAHASTTRVRPGEVVVVNLDLAEYRGARRREALAVEIPTGIPDGRYSLLVGDGVSLDIARLTLEQTQPVTFHQALALLGSLHSRSDIVVLGVFGGRGLAVAGEVMPQLPGSVRSLWSAAPSTSAIPLQLAIADQQEMRLDVPVLGAVRIDLEVHREGPLGPETSDDPSDSGTGTSPAASGADASGSPNGTVQEDQL